MGKLWTLLKHHWGKALITAIIGAGLTAAGAPPAAVGILAKAGGDAAQAYAEEKAAEEQEAGPDD